MDRSISPVPHPMANSADGERRRSVRQKLHTPVYASFNGPQAGMIVDLSELLDLHEDGFAIQTGERLETNRAINLCLDLPETKSYVHGSGQVIWSDDSGRGGIRFSTLSDSSRKILKEWLFANMLIACSNYAARTEQRARHEHEEIREQIIAADPAAVDDCSPVVSIGNEAGAQPFSELDPELELEIVRRKVRELGGDVDAVLQLITICAVSLTESTGAAMAFLTDDKLYTDDKPHLATDAFVPPGEVSSPGSAGGESLGRLTMICRARSGEPAPPLGARLDTKNGIAGECLRSGRLVFCENTENDQRVDGDLCRSLGIGSLMAAPIVSDLQVIGVLEVLSPHARGFTNAQRMALDELVAMLPRLYDRSAQPQTAQSEVPAGEKKEKTSSTPATPEVLRNEPGNEIFEQAAPQVAEADVAAEDVAVENVEASSALPSQPERPVRLLYRALLGLSLVVALIALGYAFIPAVKKWAELPPEARWSFVKPVKAGNVADASPAASVQATDLSSSSESNDSSSVDPNSVRRNPVAPQPQSLQEVQKIAAAGNADAQWQMGVRYHDGQGVPQDDVQAVQWFRRAAEQGSVAAQGALGAYYWRGRGVPADLSKAYFWSAIAMAQGDEMSKSRIEGLSSQMTRTQISAARQQAEEWIRARRRKGPSTAN